MKKYLIFVLFPLLFMSCLTDLPDDTVAVIDGEVLSKASFFKWIHPLHFEKLTGTSQRDTLEHYLLLNLVRKELESNHDDRDLSLVRRLYQWEKDRLIYRVFQTEVVEKMYSEENLKRLHEELQLRRDVNVVRLVFGEKRSRKATRQLAWKIYEQSRTTDLKILAQKYSDIPIHRDTGGFKIMNKSFTPSTSILDSAVWHTDIGKVSQPFRNANEYDILKVNREYKVKDATSFESNRAFLEEIAPLALKEKIPDAGRAYMKELRRKADVNLDANRVSQLVEKISEFLALPENAALENNPVELIEQIPGPLQLGSYANVPIDKKWLMDKVNLEAISTVAAFKDSDRLTAWIQRTIDTDLWIMRARELGYDQSEGHQTLFHRYKLKAYYNHYIAEYLVPVVEPTDEEIQSYYEEYKNDPAYLTRPQARVQVIRLLDKALADDVFARAKSGENYTDLAKAYHQTNGVFKNAQGFLPVLYQKEYGEIGEVAIHMDLNEIHEPVKYGGSYVVVKVIEKIPAVPKFLQEVRDEIRDAMLNKRLTDIREQAFRQLKRKHNARLNPRFIETYLSTP